VRLPERSGAFAYVPPTPPDLPELGREAVRAAARAEEALDALRALASQLPNQRLITRTQERREAVRSSQIEGTRTDEAAILRYEATGSRGAAPEDLEVTVNYARALQAGLGPVEAQGRAAFTLAFVQELHRALMSGDGGYADPPGALRTVQNWIGGRRLDEALMVPPPPDRIRGCMDALVERLSTPIPEDTNMQPLQAIRLAVVHAWFEAIHPFRDGNGRVGRLLIPLMLTADGHPPIYVSGFLKENQSAYYEQLRIVDRTGRWDGWVELLAEAVAAACRESTRLTVELLGLREEWMERLAGLRSDASARAVADLLLGQPLVSARLVRQRLGVSAPVAHKAIDELVRRGVLTQRGTARRNRTFEAAEVLAILG